MKNRTHYEYWNLCTKINRHRLKRIIEKFPYTSKRLEEYDSTQDKLRIKAGDILESQGKLLFPRAKQIK